MTHNTSETIDLVKHETDRGANAVAYGTHNTREWEKEFDEKFSAFTFNNGGALELTLWDVVDERIHPTNEVGFEIYNFIHHQLQKAREELAGEVRLLVAKHYKTDEFDAVGFLNDLQAKLDQDKTNGL